MPITQTRMLALINSGLDYKAAYESVRAIIEAHHAAVLAGTETPEHALATIYEHSRPHIVLQHPADSAACLAVEHAHFKSFRKRNSNAKNRAERKRRDQLAGIMSAEQPRHPQLSKSISPSHGFAQSSDSDQIQSDSALDFTVQPVSHQSDHIDKSSILDFVKSLPAAPAPNSIPISALDSVSTPEVKKD